MDIFKLTNVEIKSVVKAHNPATGSQSVQYGKFLRFYQLIYVVKGEAEIVFNNTVFINKPGSVVLLPAGACSCYRAKIISDEDCVAVFFHADFPQPPDLLTKCFAKSAALPTLFEKMYQTWMRKEPGYYNQCMSLFYAVLSEMERCTTKYMPCRKEEKISKAVDYIHAHYADSDFSYDRLHCLCGISYTHFKNIFKERFSVTPAVYVRTLKVQRACELLSTNKFSVAEVALACGFSDVPYFCKVFKKETGITPGSWSDAP